MGLVHNEIDNRDIDIESIGICNYKLPLTFVSMDEYGSIANISSNVFLDKSTKAAHLSRIIEVLDTYVANKKLSIKDFEKIIYLISEKIKNNSVSLKIDFDIVVPTTTPKSNKITYLNSNICLSGKLLDYTLNKSVSATATGAMLCPNSKMISKYGAHSQKCLMKSSLHGKIENILIEEFIKILFSQFSSEVYGLVKSVDEKFMTEKAYENPKFSEDLVRDTLINLKKYYNGGLIETEIRNLESIHQHDVFCKGKTR